MKERIYKIEDIRKKVTEVIMDYINDGYEFVVTAEMGLTLETTAVLLCKRNRYIGIRTMIRETYLGDVLCIIKDDYGSRETYRVFHNPKTACIEKYYEISGRQSYKKYIYCKSKKLQQEAHEKRRKRIPFRDDYIKYDLSEKSKGNIVKKILKKHAGYKRVKPNQIECLVKTCYEEGKPEYSLWIKGKESITFKNN